MATADADPSPALQRRLRDLAEALVEPATLARAHDVLNFIFVYPPQEELLLRDGLPGFGLALQENGRHAEFISLAAVMAEVLEAGGWTDRIAAREPASGLQAANDTIAQILTMGPDSLEARVRRRVASLDAAKDIAILHRAGALFPVYRTSALMAHLEGLDVPVILLFPGRSEPPTGLSFMGRADPDSQYRAEILGNGGRSG